jgi:hypothetical protein
MEKDDASGNHGQAVSVAAQEEEEMEVHGSCICGMLTNLGQLLPLERIHTMLKIFVAGSEVKYNKTPHPLSLSKVCGPDGRYKLFKN